MRKLEKELLHIKEKVRRSKLSYWEKRQAYEEWDEFITRIIEIDVFNQAYQALVASYVAALDTLNTAADQHDSEALNDVAGGYASGKTTSYTALDQLSEARAYLEQCKQLEPSADLSEFENAINIVESWTYDFQRACDLGNAGMDDEHNALIDQIRPTFNAFPRDISFDIVSWFQAERDNYIIRIEEHLAKEAEYRRRAAEVWAENNP